jgi:hypothetical protein
LEGDSQHLLAVLLLGKTKEVAMKKSTLILAVAALAALAAFTVPIQAADGVTVTRQEISGTFFNPCTNENVVMSGTALFVIERSSEENRGLEFHSANLGFHGVGETSDTRYVDVFAITISLQGTETTSDGGAFAETNAIHERLVAPGPGNDLVFSIVFHFTINADGEVVAWHNLLTLGDCL